MHDPMQGWDALMEQMGRHSGVFRSSSMKMKESFQCSPCGRSFYENPRYHDVMEQRFMALAFPPREEEGGDEEGEGEGEDEAQPLSIGQLLQAYHEVEYIPDLKCSLGDDCPGSSGARSTRRTTRGGPAGGHHQSMLVGPVEAIPVKLERGVLGDRPEKITTAVQLEERCQFLVADEDPNKKPKQVWLELIGVACHYGESLDTGHYVAYTREGVATWVKCNDETVTPSSWEAVQREGAAAYVLLFDGNDIVRHQRSACVCSAMW